jgi:hypothetical protein
MSSFLYRLHESGGDIRVYFWSDYLIRKRLSRGQDSAGRKLHPVRVGRFLI